jgi:hypothetical protein
MRKFEHALSCFSSHFSALLIMKSARRTDMHRECTGINKTTFSLHTVMKSSIWMEYFMEDFQTLVDEFVPDVCTDEHWKKMGLPSGVDKSLFVAFAQNFKSKVAEKQAVLNETFEYERQILQVCQNKGAEFLKSYSGNAAYSEKTAKRVTFWRKDKNRKDNEEKQSANKSKAKQNGNNANFLKNGGGNGQNGGGNGGQGRNQNSNNNWQKNNGNNSGGGGYNSSNSNGYNKPNFSQNSNDKPFTAAKCPNCSDKPHGSLPCKK